MSEEVALGEQTSDDALARIEQEVRRANVGRELLYGFVFLMIAHTTAIRFLLPMGNNSAGPNVQAWTALGGIGTLAVWFAFAGRPIAQRITRAGIVIAISAVMCGQWFSYLNLPQQRGQFTQYRLSGINRQTVPIFAGADTTPIIMLCWLVGATVAAFGIHWFFGVQLLPPDAPDRERKPLSLRSIFLLTVFAALISLYVRGPNWQNRVSYFTNGATLGLVATAMAYAVFATGTLKNRIAVPLATITIIVLADILIGGLTWMWQGNMLLRIAEVSMFGLSLGVSPLLSFLYLKQLGYRMR